MVGKVDEANQIIRTAHLLVDQGLVGFCLFGMFGVTAVRKQSDLDLFQVPCTLLVPGDSTPFLAGSI